MGYKAEDLVNKKYGDLLILSRNDDKRKSTDVYWNCKCINCDASLVYSKTQLKKFINTKGCPKCREKFENLINREFGRLIVIQRINDRVYPNDERKINWLCKCECGNYTEATSNILKRGEKQSCGCLRKEKISEQRSLDLTEKRFYRLIAQNIIGKRNGNNVWHCICDCGKIKDTTTHLLMSGQTKSCGCLQRERAGVYKFKDLTGQIIGDWEVLYQNGHTNQGIILWRCRCKRCGNEYDVNGGNLRLNATTMCENCSHKENGKKLRSNLIGYRFGKLSVIDFAYVQNNCTFWKCKCDCGIERILPVNVLTSGNTRSCGCWHRSKYEDWVLSYLENYGFDYECQVKFENLLSDKNNYLSYDFGIKINDNFYKFLIECQGQQHYKSVDRFGGDEAFCKQQIHDDLKRKYAEDIGIQLIEIPYYDVKSYEDIEKILNVELKL